MKRLLLLFLASTLVLGYASAITTVTVPDSEKILTDKDFLKCVDGIHELMKVGRLTKDAESVMNGFLETKKEDEELTEEEMGKVFTTPYATLERIHNSIGEAISNLAKKYPEIKDYDAKKWTSLFEKGFKARGIDISTMFLFEAGRTPCDGPRALEAAGNWTVSGWIGGMSAGLLHPALGIAVFAWSTYTFVNETLDAGCGDD